MSRRRARGLRPLAAAFAGLLALASLLLWLRGGAAPSPAIGGAWTLTRADGQTVTDRTFRGRFLLVYFGYASCPDICPMTLSRVADAMRILGTRAARLQPLFITIDPGRDTPASVGRYAARFSPRLIGLTGTPAQIGKVATEYRVRVVIHPTASGASIDHSAVLYLVGPDGAYLAPIPAEASGTTIAATITPYLS